MAEHIILFFNITVFTTFITTDDYLKQKTFIKEIFNSSLKNLKYSIQKTFVFFIFILLIFLIKYNKVKAQR